MPMSARLLRPRQTIHPETADWANRVRTNGGSVSGTTLSAVDRFVKAIHAAGIRGRFYRLNLFCGNSDASLNAVRTPLYRGPSLGGTQYGGTTDTNVNFVQGDYAETGASGGLTGNGSSKYLNAGLPMTYSGDNLLHAAAGFVSATGAGYQCFMGARYNLSASLAHEVRDSSANFRTAVFSGGVATSAFSPTTGRNVYLQNSQASSNLSDIYSRGTLLQTLSGGGYSAANATAYLVFAGDTSGTPSAHFGGRMDFYSIGLRFTSTAQVNAFHAAVDGFRTAMGRT